jgi:hypothetical protein
MDSADSSCWLRRPRLRLYGVIPQWQCTQQKLAQIIRLSGEALPDFWLTADTGTAGIASPCGSRTDPAISAVVICASPPEAAKIRRIAAGEYFHKLLLIVILN